MSRHVFVAGTFDGLHKGHRFLLSEAFRHGKRITIGLTSDEFVKKFKIQNSKFKIGTQKERKKNLTRWLGSRYARIIYINDLYEPAASATGVDALVVTAETRKRGEEINRKRKERGLPPLTLIDVPLVAASDGRPISSTRMRNGQIDGHGRLIMPESLRPILQKPLGPVLKGGVIEEVIVKSRGFFVITVGDVTTKTFLDAGRVPDVAIIDGRVGRNVIHAVGKGAIRSGPGYISEEAVAAIKKSLPVIEIDGEEDLLVLPAVIHAPVGSRVYYGQPQRGMVEVRVNKATKQKAEKLLHSFLLQSQ